MVTDYGNFTVQYSYQCILLNTSQTSSYIESLQKLYRQDYLAIAMSGRVDVAISSQLTDWQLATVLKFKSMINNICHNLKFYSHCQLTIWINIVAFHGDIRIPLVQLVQYQYWYTHPHKISHSHCHAYTLHCIPVIAIIIHPAGNKLSTCIIAIQATLSMQYNCMNKLYLNRYYGKKTHTPVRTIMYTHVLLMLALHCQPFT